MSAKPRLCPSAPCSEDARLLGVVSAEGVIAFLQEAPQVGAAFVAIAREGREPERRFRFASPCRAKACGNWDGSGCGLPARIQRDLAEHDAGTHGSDLARCGIRETCVWFAQEGAVACASCKFVVTRL